MNARLRRLAPPVSALLLLGVLASLPWWATPAVLYVAGLTLAAGLFALSWNLLFGYAGIASFGHAAFFSIGAYLTALALQHQWPLHFLVTLGAAALAGAVLAFLLGALALTRLSGIHFAVLTLAVAEVVRALISATRALGAEDGLSGLPRPDLALGGWVLPLQSATAYYLFLLAVCALAAAALWLLCHGRFGRVLNALRQDPDRAAFIGLDVRRYRIAAFTISGAVAALAGAVTAPWTQIVSPESAGWLHSAQPMLNTLLGGSGSFWGPLVGSAVHAVLTYSTRTLAGVSELVSGAILLVVILIAPSGILGALGGRSRRAAAAPAGEERAAPAAPQGSQA